MNPVAFFSRCALCLCLGVVFCCAWLCVCCASRVCVCVCVRACVHVRACCVRTTGHREIPHACMHACLYMFLLKKNKEQKTNIYIYIYTCVRVRIYVPPPDPQRSHPIQWYGFGRLRYVTFSYGHDMFFCGPYCICIELLMILLSRKTL